MSADWQLVVALTAAWIFLAVMLALAVGKTISIRDAHERPKPEPVADEAHTWLEATESHFYDAEKLGWWR